MESLLTIAAAFGYGILSALVPVFNAELYVGLMAAAASTPVAWASTVMLALGTSVGKTIIFEASRHGSSRFGIGSVDRAEKLARTRLGQWSIRVGEVLVAWLQHRHLGPLTVFVSAVIGLPPLFVVAVVAGASRQNVVSFAVMVFLGRLIRFAAVTGPIVAWSGSGILGH